MIILAYRPINARRDATDGELSGSSEKRLANESTSRERIREEKEGGEEGRTVRSGEPQIPWPRECK